jgi:tRNA threonylcarbamoyladenosine biosynthesis protein TsaB
VTRVLALDTATDIATACVAVDGDVCAEGVLGPERYAAQRILELADELLEQAGVRRQELDAIVVGTGPGSFTGLRIGIAAARGLGLALGLPVAGVSTLDALRAGAGEGAYAVIDARRREVFAAGPDLEPSVLASDALAARLPAGSLAVGDGALRYAPLLAAAGVHVPPPDDDRHAPQARFHAALAAADRFRTSSEPRYLRRPDAEPEAA